MIIGGCFAAVMAFLYGLIVFRLSGTYFALSTVALLHITRMIIYTNQEIFGLKTGGAVGLFIHWKEDSFVGMQFSDKTWYYFLILIMLCLAVFISASIKNSKLGYYLSAIKTNPDAAASLGVNVMKCKVIANCISAFLLACGGVFFVFLQTVVDPLRVLGYELSQQILLYCVVGGLGTLGGPIASAFILSPLSDILRGTLGSQYAGLSLVVYGIVLMLIIMFLPNGIWPLIEKLFRPIFSKSSSKSGPIAGNTGREGE